jgi:threonine synthase
LTSTFILRCMPNGCEFPSDSHNLVCANCGGPLEAVYEYEALRKAHVGLPVDKSQAGVWRYSPLLPKNTGTPVVTLGEGATPLVRASRIAEAMGLERVYVKDDSRNPTLSFKDRKSTVAISKAAEFGATGVVNMTAGNAGSSVAAYASRAGIPAYIFTIDGISDSKLAKLLSYGARVFRTNAPTKELMTFVGDVAKRYGMVNMTAASRFNPYVKEGSKTSIFEVFEELGGSLPDWIFVPIGGGGNLAGIYKGLRELKLLGLIEKFPRIVGVQGKDCAPVVEAFRLGLRPDQIPVIANPSTIAHSILDSWAPDGDQALTAIRASGGLAVGVSDEELLESMKTLSGQEGLYLEPASAAPLAALGKLVGDGTMGADESVVLFATGSGSNQPDATIAAWGRPPIVELDLEGFSKYLSK